MRRLLLWSCGMVLLAGVSLATAQTCRKVYMNAVNAKQCRTVGSAAVDILVANTSRCSAAILNYSANDMMCADFNVDGAPTATTGFPIPAGQTLALGLEAQGRWQCIRAGAADAVACIAEGRP